jgi:hypothetical protein
MSNQSLILKPPMPLAYMHRAPRLGAEPYLPHYQHRLGDDAAVHLARADAAVVEDDWGLSDLEAHLVGAVGDLNLE